MLGMLRSLLLSLLMAATITFFSISADAAEGEISCPHKEQKPISFMKWDTRDSLTLELLGDDCTKSVVVLVVRDEHGAPQFWDAWPLWNLSVYSLEEENQVGITFRDLQNINVTNSKDIEPYTADFFQDGYFYLGEFMTPEKFKTVRKSNVPVLCIPVHYENTRCYYYDEEEHVTVMLYGFGA
jgi:hypothetical protein